MCICVCKSYYLIIISHFTIYLFTEQRTVVASWGSGYLLLESGFTLFYVCLLFIIIYVILKKCVQYIFALHLLFAIQIYL